MKCCGYLFREKPTLSHIRRDVADFYGIPVSQFDNIKAGADWTTAEGEVVVNSRLTTPADAPRAYAYCSDTRYIPTLHERLKGVTTLYHESTYGEDNHLRAEKYFHSTAREAAMVARQAGVAAGSTGNIPQQSTYRRECRVRRMIFLSRKSDFSYKIFGGMKETSYICTN